MSTPTDGTPLAEPTTPAGVSITWKPAGPLVVQGDSVTYLDNEGQPITPPVGKIPGRVSLCGCGLSATKPFCDGSHKR